MSVSYFGRPEPEGRRLGSDFSLLGKWAKTFSTLTEPPRKYSLSKLSNPDKKTLFSTKPGEFRLKDGPNGTVKLETIDEDLENDMARWDAFFKDMDPEVLDLTQHPNFRKSHHQVAQLKLTVSGGEHKGGMAAAGVDATAHTGAQKIEAHVINAGKTPGMQWKKVPPKGSKPTTIPPASLSTDSSGITVDNIKFDNQAFKIKVSKGFEDGLARGLNKVAASQGQTTPQSKVSGKYQPPSVSSEDHGSETTASSVSSGSPRFSADEGSPSSTCSSTNTSRTRTSSYVSNDDQPSSPGLGTALFNYLNGTSAATSNTNNGFAAANSNLSVSYSRTYLQPSSGGVSQQVLTTSQVTYDAPVVNPSSATAGPAARRLPLARVQVHPEVECYDIFFRPGPAELAPEYWTTKAGKSRFLAHKLQSLRNEDNKLRKSPETRDVASGPVHIFIDLSNIIIGFYDSLKMKRGIPAHKRVKPPVFSFENFDAILARGRKTEKKIVAGSVGSHSKRPSYMTEAEQLDYEMNIMQRVPKPASPLHKRKSRTNESATSDTSGDDYFVGPMKQGEQGVDELLHLKLLQSAMDKPSGGTIVLATGDAAHAEYSDGFKKNIERVLNYGWNIELYGWTRNISSAWRDPAFSQQWGRRFRIIELDDFCEELFGLTIDSFEG